MTCYSAAAKERTRNILEVILRALAKRINWCKAAEVIGICDRQMRREKYGFDKLSDGGRGKPSPKRVPVETLEGVLGPTTPTPEVTAFFNSLVKGPALPCLEKYS